MSIEDILRILHISLWQLCVPHTTSLWCTLFLICGILQTKISHFLVSFFSVLFSPKLQIAQLASQVIGICPVIGGLLVRTSRSVLVSWLWCFTWFACWLWLESSGADCIADVLVSVCPRTAVATMWLSNMNVCMHGWTALKSSDLIKCYTNSGYLSSYLWKNTLACFYLLYLPRIYGGLVSNFSGQWKKIGVHRGQVFRPSRDKQS